jgi:methyl-accepting chemotaxis protein
LVVFLVASRESRVIHEQADKQAEARVVALSELLGSIDQLVMARVQGAMKLLKDRGQMLGQARVGAVVPVSGRQVPDLILGSEGMANNHSLVDSVTRLLGGTATLFSRDGDNFVRIATNVQKAGARATGTLLDPQGRVIEKIRSGQGFFGQVDILGSPYITGYEPILDAQRQVIGIWYVGYQADLKALEQVVKGSRLLNRGFVALIDDQQRVRLHSDHVDGDLVKQVVADSSGDWMLHERVFRQWGYRLVAAYPEDEVDASVTHVVISVVLGGLVTFGVVLAVVLFLTRNLISRPLRHAVHIIDEISKGQLNHKIEVRGEDELAVMLRGVDRLQSGLRDFIEQVRETASRLLESAALLNDITRHSVAGVNQQQSQTEQVASAMTEMSATVDEVARNAGDAAEAARHADEEARNGSRVVNQSMKAIQQLAQQVESTALAINELDEHSDQISTVLDVIRGIAEQTNLLALNAAIEAARAGEQGRGFAVVADEVRTLASRTHDSTEEIQKMTQSLQSGARNAVTAMQTGCAQAKGCAA